MRGLSLATVAVAAGVLVAAATQAADLLADYDGDIAPSTTGSMDGLVSSDWIYRWHRGGAWKLHDNVHPCHTPNSSCTIDAPASSHPAAVLHVNTSIAAHLETVRVFYDFDASTAPTPGDFVAVYCVNEDEPSSPQPLQRSIESLLDFIDYASIPTVNASSTSRSTGTVDFGPLVNMRCSYQFKYLRLTSLTSNKRTYTVVAVSPHVEMERGHSEPLQVHLALTGTQGEMRVMWTTGRVAHVHVHYGAHSAANVNAQHAAATTTSYVASDMCNAPATTVAAQYYRHPGYFHSAVLTGLVPGETYYYRLGSHTGVASDVLRFTFSRVVPGHQNNTIQRFLIVGDVGEHVLVPLPHDAPPERRYAPRAFMSRPMKRGAQTVMQRIIQDVDDDAVTHSYAAVVHVGDLSYAKGQTYLWDQFMAVIAPVASRIPYMVAVGNHDYGYALRRNSTNSNKEPSGAGNTSGWHPLGGNYGDDSHGECGVPTSKRFVMPTSKENPSNGVFWYSFTAGLTHHVVLSSEHDCATGSPMRHWLEQELQSVDRTQTPWVLVYLHRPLYCSEAYESDYRVSKLLRNCLERIFLEHRVDVVFSGHYHAYERTCPVYQAQCRHKRLSNGMDLALAPVHVMVGSGGAPLDDVAYKARKDWSVYREQAYGHARLHVHNATHAQIEFVRARDRVVTDRTWLISHHDWSYHRGE